MFYPLQIIRDKETGRLGTFIKIVEKRNEEPWLIKVMLEDGNSTISTIGKWEEATLPEKKYKCIYGFSLEMCDDDGFTIPGEYITVEEGSLWIIPEDKDYRFIGGEIRLECVKADEAGWIEIPKDMFETYFVKV